MVQAFSGAGMVQESDRTLKDSSKASGLILVGMSMSSLSELSR
jgi:hypothetical protein